MNRKIALVTGGIAATVLAATVATVPALAADGAKSITQSFDAKSSASPLELSKNSLVITDNDVKGTKTIGNDVLYCTGLAAATSHCYVAFAEKGGLLYAEFALSGKTGALKGSVTGGTGSFTKAKGTLTGQTMSKTDVKITLTYKK
jgi:hypothetical protein